MRDAYREWIAEHYPTQASAFGACKDATAAMIVAFSELRRVNGHYFDHLWGEREHWWCVDVDGSIVDPTAKQFPSRGHGAYVELDPNAQTPSGMCPECGGYVYNGETFCSDGHAAIYMAYLATGII